MGEWMPISWQLSPEDVEHHDECDNEDCDGQCLEPDEPDWADYNEERRQR